MAKYFLRLGDREVEAEVDCEGTGLRVNLGGGWRSVDLRRLGSSSRFVLNLDDRLLDVLARTDQEEIDLVIDGVVYSVVTARPRRAGGRGRGDGDDEHFQDNRWRLISPITGSVVEIRVGAGEAVEPGTILMVVEAMKMQNELRSRVAGIVSTVNVTKGQRVETGTVLLEISAV